jgi:hypothetical protein
MLRAGHADHFPHGPMNPKQNPIEASKTGTPWAGEPIIIQGGKGSVELRTDGVVHLIWKPQGTIEAADARAAVAAVNEVCQGSEHPMLVDMASTEAVNRDARSIFSTPCAASRIALLGSNPVDRVIANLFLRVHQPSCPTRFFSSRTEAMDWLAPGGAN